MLSSRSIPQPSPESNQKNQPKDVDGLEVDLTKDEEPLPPIPPTPDAPPKHQKNPKTSKEKRWTALANSVSRTLNVQVAVERIQETSPGNLLQKSKLSGMYPVIYPVTQNLYFFSWQHPYRKETTTSDRVGSRRGG